MICEDAIVHSFHVYLPRTYCVRASVLGVKAAAMTRPEKKISYPHRASNQEREGESQKLSKNLLRGEKEGQVGGIASGRVVREVMSEKEPGLRGQTL